MRKFGKWIGGGLGWAFMGPIGGLIGFAVGSILDNSDTTNIINRPGSSGHIGSPGRTQRGDFMSALVVLVAAVMKSDNKIVKDELDFVKLNFKRSFGESAARDGVLILRDILKQDIPVEEISKQISRHMDYSSRLQLLHFLFGLSRADGHVADSELKTIERISYYMGIGSSDLNSIKASYYDDLSSAFAMLEISSDASDDEVKKAYRKMAVKYHPDKVAYLGDDIKQKAKEKFQKLNESYKKIKKARGLS